MGEKTKPLFIGSFIDLQDSLPICNETVIEINKTKTAVGKKGIFCQRCGTPFEHLFRNLDSSSSELVCIPVPLVFKVCS